MSAEAAVRVEVGGERPYPVLIGRGLLGAAEVDLAQADRVAIVHPPALHRAADELRRAFEGMGAEVLILEIPDGEPAKSAAVAAAAWEALGRAGFTRSDALIGVGGGATTDVAGFIAGTWLRGVRIVQVPTTLLGMVDAAIGGKTGINTAEGKNLVGVFHNPSLVICDLDLLGTLPPADYAAGMAEVAKVGFVLDSSILDDLLRDPKAALDSASALAPSLVERAVRAKAQVVTADFRETGTGGGIGREVLNYGHTFGHAVEKVEGYSWRHGDAVSVGMIFVAELARAGGFITDDDVRLHRQVLGSLGLPTRYPGGQWPALLAAMQIDKKSRGHALRFVVLHGIADPAVWVSPGDEALQAAFKAVTA